GRIWAGSQSLRLLVQPVLAQLAADTGLAAIFAIPDAFHMRALAAEMGTGGPLRTYPLVGELFPAHAGATSKAYYATLPDRERQRIFADRPMARFTPSTTVDPAALEQQFEKIRRQGYATSAGEYDRDVSTVAMVVRLRNESFGSLSLGQHGEFRTDVPTLVRFLERARRESEAILTGRARCARRPATTYRGARARSAVVAAGPGRARRPGRCGLRAHHRDGLRAAVLPVPGDGARPGRGDPGDQRVRDRRRPAEPHRGPRRPGLE